MMVESEAKELPEKQMLEAVMFGHAQFQPVIKAIIKLAEKAAKDAWDIKLPDAQKYAAQVKKIAEADLRAAFSTKEKQKRHELVDAAQAEGARRRSSCPRATPARRCCSQDTFKALQERDRARRRRQDGQAHRRARPQDRAPHPVGGARAAAHARLGAVHARRDAGARGGDARHRRGRAVRRRAGRHPQRALHAPLQLPAVLGGRDGPHGRPRPARDRPRQARLARRAPDDAGPRRVPLHDPRRLRDHRDRTARPRWRPCAAPRWR